MQISIRATAVGALLAAMAHVANAQGTPPVPRTLAAPTLLSEPMARSPIPAVLTLANGDLLVLASGRVTLLDSALRLKRTVVEPPATTPGARGPGAGSGTRKMFYYRGDSVLLADGTPAMSLFGPTVDSSRTVAFGRVQDISRLMAAGAPRLDTQGRFVYTGTPTTAASVTAMMAGAPQPDTVPVFAYSQQARQLDTIAFVKTGTMQRMTMLREGGGLVTSMVTYPFNMDDHWGVLSDGTVMIVRAVGCVVEVSTPTGLRRIPRAIPCDRRAVSAAEKDSIFAQQQTVAGLAAGVSSTGRFTAAPIAEYPDYRPAYRGATADNEGHLWLTRNTAASPGVGTSYDVVDKDAMLVDRVALPAGTQLLGFGKRGIYVWVLGPARGTAPATIGLIPK
jgi:hypothetical protein